MILGFVVEGNTSRRLTHQKSRAEVLAAVDVDQPRFIVGAVRPWDRTRSRT